MDILKRFEQKGYKLVAVKVSHPSYARNDINTIKVLCNFDGTLAMLQPLLVLNRFSRQILMQAGTISHLV